MTTPSYQLSLVLGKDFLNFLESIGITVASFEEGIGDEVITVLTINTEIGVYSINIAFVPETDEADIDRWQTDIRKCVSLFKAYAEGFNTNRNDKYSEAELTKTKEKLTAISEALVSGYVKKYVGSGKIEKSNLERD